MTLSAHEGEPVLVADDDRMIRKMVMRILEREGYRVEEAKDGAEAIEKCHDASYRVILLDMMMPRLDGMKVIDWLREHRPELLPRVVVMTAFTQGAVEKAEKVCSVVYKPFDVHNLIERVRELANAG